MPLGESMRERLCKEPTAVERHRVTESRDRQYALQERAVGLGGPRESVRIIDADLGRSGASATGRSGFAELTTMVGLCRVKLFWRWRFPVSPGPTPPGTCSR